MSYFLFAAGFLGVLCLGFWLTSRACDSVRLGFWAIAAFLYWSACLGFLVAAAVESEKKGPCVTWETQMHYNAATKSLMPAKVCTLRGEWVPEQ